MKMSIHSMFPNCVDRFGCQKKKQNNNKQAKKNQGKNKQIKNWNNSTYHEPKTCFQRQTKKVFS